MMEFDGEFTVDGTPEELWKYFTDPDILMDCAPGCNKMEVETQSQITAGLTVGVGSVKPSFDVEAIVTECEQPDRLEIQAVGEASRNSFEVTAWQELTDNGDETTTVTWQANAEISGIIASMGERAIESVATKLVNEFFQDLEDHVNAGTPAQSQLQAASTDEITRMDQRATQTSSDDSGGIVGATTHNTVRMVDRDWPRDAQSFAAGMLLGVIGGSLWHRLQATQQQTEANSPSTTSENSGEPQSTPVQASPPSRLTLVLTAALSAAGAVLWKQYTSETTTQPANSDTEAPAQDNTSTNSSEGGTSSTEAGNSIQTDASESDNPLDRLESRQ